MHPYDRHILLKTLSHLLADIKPRSSAADNLSVWLHQFADQIGLDLSAFPLKNSKTSIHHLDAKMRAVQDNPSAPQEDLITHPDRWAALLNLVRQQASRPVPQRASRIQKNIDLLQLMMNMPEREAGIFGLLYRFQEVPAFNALMDGRRSEVPLSPKMIRSCISASLNIPPAQLSRALLPSGYLARSGLLVNPDFDTTYGSPNLLSLSVTRALAENPRSITELSNLIVGAPVKPELEWEDFDHVAGIRDLAAELLAGARREKQKGVNILVFGESGTGKTQFCRIIARQADLHLYDISFSNSQGTQSDGADRYADLSIANTLLAGREDAAMLFDEMEDLLGSHAWRRLSGGVAVDSTIQSKAFFNDLLEQNSTPTLWTCNSIRGLDPAFQRRMTFMFELKAPPKSARERIWRRSAARYKVKLGEKEVARYASTVDLSPGYVRNAVLAARLTGNRAAIGEVLEHASRALGRDRPNTPVQPAADYDPALVHCDQPLEQLTTQLLRLPHRRFSLCLYGPPGTGKSAYARWLASQLGMEIMFRRASDLLSKWVGESEQNIAEMFRTAERENAFLIIDEADSLLRERERADRSWEVTQVNEMLTWMEHHPLPFVMTTNLMEGLDRAAMRRFIFKAKFDYLRPVQAMAAFRHFLKAEPPEELGRLDRLTPGDFRVVRSKQEILGIDSPSILLDMLRQEIAIKRDAGARNIGFLGNGHAVP